MGEIDRTPVTAGALDAAWEAFVAGLGRARAALSDPACHPPPATARNQAEGHRYLLGQLARLIEAETLQDPDFPYFMRASWTLSKFTIENPDNLYLYAPLDPDGTYVVRGTPAPGGMRPPTYVIFETHQVAPGDSGGLAELVDGSREIVDFVDSTRIRTAADGAFELVIGPERPAGAANFLATTDGKGRRARKLFVREIFADWDAEVPYDLEIARTGFVGGHPRARSLEVTAGQLERVGALLDNQIRFWNTFYGELLDPFGTSARPGSGLPRNGVRAPHPAAAERGGGQATNFFAGGIFDLDDDALVVEVTAPDPPAYLGAHLGNFWGESLDYANHTSSLNHAQAAPDGDGVRRYVVAHRDPGVANWLDTTGHPGGYLTLRFTYPAPPPEARWPQVRCEVTHVDKVAGQFEAGGRCSPEARRAQVAARQRHVARRYRQY